MLTDRTYGGIICQPARHLVTYMLWKHSIHDTIPERFRPLIRENSRGRAVSLATGDSQASDIFRSRIARILGGLARKGAVCSK